MHQPAWPLLQLYDGVVLMAPGGRVAFEGAPDHLEAFFSSRLRPCPADETVPDHAIKVLIDGVASGEAYAVFRPPTYATSSKKDPSAPPDVDDGIDPVTQYLVLLHRQVRVWTADATQGGLMMKMIFTQALWLGLLATGMTDCISKGNLIQIYSGAVLMASANWLCVSLPLERPAVLREYKNGMYGVRPYLAARTTLCCFVALASAVASMVVFYALLQTRWAPPAVSRPRGERATFESGLFASTAAPHVLRERKTGPPRCDRRARRSRPSGSGRRFCCRRRRISSA